MLYKATRLIQEAMDKVELKYSIDEVESSSVVKAGFGIDNGPDVLAYFVSRDNDNDVAIRVWDVISNISKSKELEVLKLVNECNNEYRFLKFVLRNDRLDIEYDVSADISDENLGNECVKIFLLLMKVLDAIYPRFMKVIWG